MLNVMLDVIIEPIVLGAFFVAATGLGIAAATGSKPFRTFSSAALVFATGWLTVRLIFWVYILIQAQYSNSLGSFRWHSPYHALNQAERWGFSRLHNQIESQLLLTQPDRAEFSAPLPDDARQRLVDGALMAEAFRREMINQSDSVSSKGALLARLMKETQHQWQDSLDEPYTLDAFTIGAEEIAAQMAGGIDIEQAIEAFEAFSGTWHGLWDIHPVDHEWSPVERFDPPDRITEGDNTIYVHALQYAWIGDGFGWNLVVSPESPDAEAVILGTVYHVRNHDPALVYHHRPHIGIQHNENLIWITRSEVFFEETFLTNEPQHYAITGFFYEWSESLPRQREAGFQAIYSRQAEFRAPFKRF